MFCRNKLGFSCSNKSYCTVVSGKAGSGYVAVYRQDYLQALRTGGSMGGSINVGWLNK